MEEGEKLVYSTEVEIEMRKQSVVKPVIPWLTEEEAFDFAEIRSALIMKYPETDKDNLAFSFFY